MRRYTSGIDHVDTRIHGGGDVCQCLSARVVEVHAEVYVRRFHPYPVDGAADGPRVGHTDRVAEGEFRDARALGLCGKVADDGDVDFAIIGIAESDGDGGREGNAGLMGERRALRQHVGAVLRAHALVLTAEGLARNEDEIDLVRLRIDGAAHTLLIQGEGDMARGAGAVEPGEHGRRIRHFRHRLRTDEAARFHAPHAGVFQTGDEFELLLCRQVRGVVLQPVAGADFHNVDAAAHLAPIVLQRRGRAAPGSSPHPP